MDNQVASKVGLAKFRPLQISNEKDSKASSNLPNGWYYNESQEADFWKSLETDSNVNPKLEIAKRESEQHEFITEMNDSSTKIKAILDKFDDIDRETLNELSQITENDDYMENTSSSFFEDAKNNVTQYMIEMKELSDSQTSLLDNLKIWFQSMGENEEFLNNEQEKAVDHTNRSTVIDFMSNYIQETEEKIERTQNVHQNVSQFWLKQMTQFKRELNQKNSEISHLKSSLEKLESTNKSSKNRQTSKKDKKQTNLQSDPELMNKMQNQLKTIEEQKYQIDDLKMQLANAHGQIGLSISNSSSSPEKIQLIITEKENEIGRLKYETETQIQMLQQRIHQLEKQNQKLQNDIILEREKYQMSLNQLSKSETQIHELEGSVHKYVQLLELERNKPRNIDDSSIDNTSNDLLLKERILEIAKCKEEIRELKLKHKEEMIEQSETLRNKFAIEKQKFINSLNSNDEQALIQSIISEYEKKLEEQNKNYEILKTNLAQQWGSKLSLLTHQYETRLKSMQASNEIALLKKKEEIQYEVQKAKLEFEDEFNKKVLVISQSFSNKIAKLEALMSRLKTHNEALKKEILSYKEILNIKNADENAEETENEDDIEEDAFNPIESMLDRTEIVKTELEEQKNLELGQQKVYFMQYFQKMAEENQKELRSLLLSLQNSLSHVDSDGENSITVQDSLEKISDTFVALNSHCQTMNQNEEEEEIDEKVSLREVTERMSILKSKIISLTAENNELRKANPNYSKYDSENEQLKMRVKFLESLQKGDTDEAAKNLLQIEKKLRMEIDVKDAIIDQLKAHICTCTLETIPIFSKDVNEKMIFDEAQKDKGKRIGSNFALNCDNVKNSLLEIDFTEGSIEIPLDYFEEEEEVANEEVASNDPKSSVKPKTTVKTKKKTVIREVPKIEYRERHKINVKKSVSPSISIEIDEKQSNLSIRRGQSMTLEFAAPSKNQCYVKTKVIDEKPAELSPAADESQEMQQGKNELKITDADKPVIFDEKMFLKTNPFSMQKKDSDHPFKKIIGLSHQKNKDVDNSPIPPPNSPTMKLVDARTQADIESFSLKKESIKKRSLFISSPMWQVNIPNRITAVICQAVRTFRGSGSMVISEYKICDFDLHPPPPIVIAADEETKARIEALQEQLKNISANSSNQKVRNDLLRQIPEMTVFFRDRLIKNQDHKIDSLRARVQSTEDQLKRIREQKLADIRRKSRAFYSASRGNISGPLIVDHKMTSGLTENSEIAASNQQLLIDKKDKNKPLIIESSVPVLNKKKVDVKFELIGNSADSLAESIRLLQGNFNFLTNQIEIGQQIITEFKGDIDSYESFLRATKNLDENNEQFIERLKQNEKLISDYHSQLNPFNVRQNQILNLLKNYKKEEDNKDIQLTDNEKLKMQQKILDEIQKKAENSQSAIDPSIIIDQIKASLKIIDEIGIIEFDEEESRILRTIRYKVEKYRTQLDNHEKIDADDLDSVLMETQSFISGIKPKVQSRMSSNNKNLLIENEDLKKQVVKNKKARIKAEKELSILKDKEINYETQVNLLKNRLSEQQEVAENSTSMYFAQIASLKSIVSQMSSGDPNNTDFINQIKKEILNLQTISETAVNQKELYKMKANEAEDRIIQTDAEKATVIRELNELHAKYEKLDAMVKKAYEEKMFYESDITRLKTEKAIEIEAQMKLENQLSQLVEENSKTNDIIKEKTEKIEKLKKKINSLKSENDELSIQVTFGLGRRRDIPKTTKETQTMFKRVKKKEIENNSQQQNNPAETEKDVLHEKENQKKKESMIININEANEIKKVRSGAREEEEEEKGIDENEPINANFDFTEPVAKLSKVASNNSNNQIILSESNSSLSSSQFEWQEDIDQDTYNDDVVLHTEVSTKQQYESIEKGEKAVSIVHSPLSVKKKKNAVFQSQQKTYVQLKSNKTRPKTVIHASRTQTNPEDLTIGNVSPGKRQLTGATQSPKPILPKSLHNVNSNILNMQVLKPLEPLESAVLTTNYEGKYPSTVPASPKCNSNSLTPTSKLQQRKQQQPKPLNFYTEADNGLSETVRITKYDVESSAPNVSQKSPIIAPTYSEQQLPNSLQMGQMQLPKMAEVHKIMIRLREKLHKVQNKLEKRVEIINDLKKKLTEAVNENKQQRLTILKAEDESKRAMIRFDALKIRYDIIFKELSVKEEDLSNCKREISELRKISAPAASSLSRLRNAQYEQIRILREKERQKGMMTMAKSAMNNATNSEAQKHLNMLMKNTQKSIARLEAKRRMWKDVEKKQVMGALGALSLIDDKKSTLSLRRSISSVNTSPFRSKLTQKNRFSTADLQINDDIKSLVPAVNLTPKNDASLISRSEQASNLTPVFAKQLENINRMKPELSEEEKKQIIRGNLQPELEARIKATEKEREEKERMDNVIITPVKK